MGAIVLFLWLLAWPIVFLPGALRVVSQNGKDVRRICGKGIFTQAVEMTWLCARHGFRDYSYYVFELYRPENRKNSSQYICRYEMKEGIYRLLKLGSWTPMQDKVGFASYCLTKNLPVTAIEVSLIDGRLADGRRLDSLPEMDLFIKRTNGRGGGGAEIFSYTDGIYRTRNNQSYNQQEMIELVSALSKKEPYLVQALEVNHPNLARLSPGALATVRIITAINEKGIPEPVAAILRMGKFGDSIVDNFHAGGIAAPINLQSGELGPATDFGLSPSLGWMDKHPTTGNQIKGFQMPHWDEIKRLAIEAHSHFADRLIIGWDIAVTPDRILLVEGNGAADVDNIQRPHRSPLGLTRYAELAAWHHRQIKLRSRMRATRSV